MIKRFYGHALFVYCALLFTTKVNAQSPKGTVRIFTQHPNAIIRIDGFKIDYGRIIKLDTGKHEVKAWAEGTRLAIRSFNLSEKEYKTLRIKLTPTKKYLDYKIKLRNYKLANFTYRYGAILTWAFYTGIEGAGLIQQRKEANRNYENAKKFEALYRDAFWVKDIINFRQNFETSKAKYDNNLKKINSKLTRIQIATGTAAIISFFTWRKAQKLRKPRFEETPRMSQFQFTPITTPNLTGIYLSHNF